ncbi:MAG: efflux RND transporter permease subunit, partial [Polaromonas sp.]
MQLAEVSIRRPVFATVLSLLIVLIGAVSFNRLSVREYPK